MDEYGDHNEPLDPMEARDVAGERMWRRVRTAANRATSIHGPRHDPENGPVRWQRGATTRGAIEVDQLRPWDDGR